MNKYSYPAVFTPEENGAYSINFPDLESCYTYGDNLTNDLMMGENVLAFTLYDYEKENRAIPAPGHSPICSSLQLNRLPAIWNRKCPDKTGFHTHFQQSGLLPDTIHMRLTIPACREKPAMPSFSAASVIFNLSYCFELFWHLLASFIFLQSTFHAFSPHGL